MKEPLDLTIIANNDRLVQIQARRPPDPAAPAGTLGDPIDITGMTIKWQYFALADAATALATKKTGDSNPDNAITITDAPNGKFQFWVKAADTRGKTPGENYIHEAVTVDTGGHPNTIANNDPKLKVGRMTIRQQYTVQD